MDKITPLPWRWDSDDLWHFGDGYEVNGDAIDPHRYTGISINKTLRDSPILQANKEYIVRSANAFPAMLAALEAIANGDYDNAHDCKAASKIASEALKLAKGD